MTDQPSEAPETAAPAAEKPQAEPLLHLITRVPSEVQALIHAEVSLASAEIRQNLIRLALAFALMLAGGVIFGIAGVLSLGALVLALAPFVGPVWSSVITAVVALVAGGVLMVAGIAKMKRGPLAPRQSINNLQSYFESFKSKSDKKAKG